jgi:hypothetical protein
MLLEGNVFHGLKKVMTAHLFVEVQPCTFKMIRQPATLGAVSEPTTFIQDDQQLREVESEILPRWDSSLLINCKILHVQRDVVALTSAAAML